MKVCVFGAGAVGGHLAARMADGGAQVSIIARGAHLEALRRDGLRVDLPDRSLHCTPKASDRADLLGPQDVVVVAVKTTALLAVAAGITPLLGPGTTVLFVANGVPWWYFHQYDGAEDGRQLPLIDPHGALWRAVGPERAIGGLAYTASSVSAPGVIAVLSEQPHVVIGEPSTRGLASETLSGRARRIAAVFEAGGLPCRVSTDIRMDVWTKLIGNLAGSPASLLTHLPLSAICDDPAGETLLRTAVNEGIALAHAMGCMVPTDTDYYLAPTRGLRHKASMSQDLDAGRPLEIDSILTQPLQFARERGVSTPTLNLLATLACLRGSASGLYRLRS
ncbi:2-dehydropantoate 2-reductase [Paraburkholderia fungorum]|uniref:ketopantoate reductase family protein n=1 Tax=Paraburkholderia fungorum TaxID=134537 RepID=UPI0038B783EC